METRTNLIHKISKITGFLLGIRFFVTLLLTFALYVSTFFLFNQEEGFRAFVFDFKVHGIIFCAVVSIFCGGIINQFYDREKDQITKPFRTKLQSFIQQKYYLYLYLILAAVSFIVAWLISPRVFVFFIIYQFIMWLYSHKLSKILIVNNLSFVAITLYPFFGMLIYYQTFSVRIFFMSLFLFLVLLVVDIIKDTLTKNADQIFGYQTIPNFFGKKVAKNIISAALFVLILVSFYLGWLSPVKQLMNYYFLSSILVFVGAFLLINRNLRNSRFYALNLLRIWIFVGILMMLADGLAERF